MDKLTLFYLKDNGNIKGFCSGIQSLDYFGSDKESYSKIFECIVIDFDEEIVRNYEKYKIENNKVIKVGV
ncbi:MAG: hypothetical protein ACLR02_08190 [Clostridium sp.]|jgi:hypothetical protein|nr:MAG TPA: hypothetical protein [Caudoviricetes sp.]